MPCINPRTVGFHSDGKTICWSPKDYSKQYATFQLPCSKCIECRLDYARSWAIRCVHEAQMHKHNSFITLTYSDDKLESPKLQYEHFQNFIKRVRNEHTIDENTKIGYFVTGEYGERTKRPHWHACIFNFYPSDPQFKYTTERGDRVFTSKSLQDTWGYGNVEIGSLTYESAGYCARYAAKKLIHGKDQDHDYHPISKKSSHNAIGKKFLERYWSDIFNTGCIILPDGNKLPIPRYYQKWLSKHRPDEFQKFIERVKSNQIETASEKATKEQRIQKRANWKRDFWTKGPMITKDEVRKKISESKLKQLQENLKL